MPMKEVTECDFARTLYGCDVELQIVFIKIKGLKHKCTSDDYINQFYIDFDDINHLYFERFIITGAPLEQIAFEDVTYWEQLQLIMHWSETHVERTLFVCWAAQAGLYEFFQIPKYPLPSKMFGVFKHEVREKTSPLMRHLSNGFVMPNSRHTEIRRPDLEKYESRGLKIIAESVESGVGIVSTVDCRKTFVVGHFEYEPYTLDNEYKRDVSKHLPIEPPRHYYDEQMNVQFSWDNDAIQFYKNWLIET